MEDLIKNIKKKFSADNLVDMMKEAKVIDENKIKEEDVRRTLEKVDPDHIVDVDELTDKLNEIADQTRPSAGTVEAKSNTTKFMDKAKSSLNVLKKNPAPEVKEEEEDYVTRDNAPGFLD